jgi:competence ComEA-like helix-hairpin-helix protein
MPYTRPQLWLLLAFAAVFLLGLGVREWRVGFPELADRLERFDREVAVEPAPPLPVPPVPLPAPQLPRKPASAEGAVAPGAKRAVRAERAAPTKGDGPAPADPRPLDLNAASTEQIARLPGIGPALARRIVEERERRGRFESTDALRGVLGLGPKKLAAVKDLLVVATE